MYGPLFCRLYDDFGWNEYPRAFAEQLWAWLDLRGAVVRRALDLGCGTGVLCRALHERGVEAEGVDLSPEMIAIAREHAPQLTFTAANMVTYRPGGRFDLITCTGDALNHIFDPDEVLRVFENAAGALNDGGYLVFDLLNEAEVPLGEPFEADASDGSRVRFHAEIDAQRVVHLTVEVLEEGRFRYRETILEKLHDVSDVLDALGRAGLRVLQCADRLLPDSLPGNTCFIVAQK